MAKPKKPTSSGRTDDRSSDLTSDDAGVSGTTEDAMHDTDPNRPDTLDGGSASVEQTDGDDTVTGEHAASDEPGHPREEATASGTSATEATPEADTTPSDPARGGPNTPTPPPSSGNGEARIGKGPGFVTLLLGGLIAGVIGYGFAYYTEFRPFAVSDEGNDTVARLEAQEGQVAELSGELESLGSRLDEQASQTTELSGNVEQIQSAVSEIQNQVAGLEPAEGGVPQETLDELRAAADEGVAGLAQQLTEMSERMDSLEAQVEEAAQSGGGTGQDLSAYESQLDELQQQLDDQRAQIAETEEQAQQMQQEAQAQTRAVTARAALTRVQAAVEGGGSFDTALADLQSATDAQVPAVLRDSAGSGLATLGQLQRRFPDAARAALDASLQSTAGEGGMMDRVGKFLQAQTGARSIEPREGDGPDAVLSRAGAAVDQGNIEDALSELDSLPDAGREAMSEWIEAAQTRVEATAAVDDLAANLNTN